MKFLLDRMHPVGSLYWSNDPTDPGEIFGGTWIKHEGVFVIGASDTYKVGTKGGSATHTLTAGEIPSHTHPFSATASSNGAHTHSMLSKGGGSDDNWGWDYVTGNSYWTQLLQASSGIKSNGAHTHSVSGTTGATGNGKAHNNMPPYLAKYCFERIE